MTKPNDTKSSLLAGGQLLPETSPEEYQKAAREDLDVTFDDARIADMRTQAVARAEAGLADWERRIPSTIPATRTWRVTCAHSSSAFVAYAGWSRRQVIATARMAWEREHRMKLQDDAELDVREVVTEVTVPFAGTTSSSIGRSDPSRTEAARADGNVIQFDPTIGVKFRQTWAPSTAPMVGSRWRLTEHTNAPVPAGPWTVSSVEWRGDEEWATLKFHAADPMERMTSRETLASFRDKFALWDEPAITRIAGDWGSPQQALEDTRRLVDEAAAEHEAEMRRLFAGPLALPSPSGPVWPGSLADLQSQPGVRSARNDGPGRVVVMLKRDASDAEWRGLRDWNDEHMGAGSVMMLEREPPTLEGYVKEQMADVPAGWNAEMWRARVLGMLEQTADRSALPGERLRLMAEYVTRVRRGASSEMVAGLSSYVPATPRWWKGEAPPRPERMGLKRGRVTR